MILSLPLLDAGGALLLILPLMALVVFMLVCGLLEGLVIHRFGIQRYRISVGHALLVNIISLLAGLVLFPMLEGYGIDERRNLPLLLALLFGATLLVEGLSLKVLNRRQPWNRIAWATLLMNAATYFILCLMLFYLD